MPCEEALKLQKEGHICRIIIMDDASVATNIDVMHIKKNACDKLLETLLDIKGYVECDT